MKKFIVLCLATLIVLVGCSSGVPQADYDAVIKERDIVQVELDAVVKERDIVRAELDTLQSELSKIDIYRISPNDKAAIKKIIQKFKDDGIPIVYEVIYSDSNDPNGKAWKPYLAKGNFADSNCEPNYTKERPGSGTIEIFDSHQSAKDRVKHLEDISNNPRASLVHNYNIINDNVLLRLNSNFSEEYVQVYINSFGGKLYSTFNGPKEGNIEWPGNQNTSQPSETTASVPEEQPKASESQSSAPSDVTIGQENALAKAKKYLDYAAFSYKGLIKQLEYEKFSNADAVYGADNCGANWNEQAAKKAKTYLDYSSFSRDSLIAQLKYEGFTNAQAIYGVEANGY